MHISFEFSGKIWYWRGPSPYHFVTMPAKHSRDLKAISHLVTYGWGMIPVHAEIGDTKWKTAMYEKDGRYIVPIKDAVRKAEQLQEGDKVTLRLEVGMKD